MMMPRKRDAEQEAAEGQEQQVGSVATRALDLWIANQARIFEEFDEVARRWLDRRREALDATRQIFEEFRADNSLGGVIRVQQEWAIGSMNRLAADIAELSGAVLNITQAAASRITEATEGAGRDLEAGAPGAYERCGLETGQPGSKVRTARNRRQHGGADRQPHLMVCVCPLPGTPNLSDVSMHRRLNQW
jgi:hypothetical protein